ncbi:MAG: TonB-dependent receptor, partial [Saprospiraceae bacterium]|nr:TonB-dependent receptor [Saprospiraceae bacterium]
QFSFFSAGIGNTAYDISGNNGNAAIGYRPSFAGNPDTKWEAAEMINVGLEGTLWDGKLNFGIEYFNNITKDLLVTRQASILDISQGQAQINVGEMVNKGIDANLSTRGNFTKDFSYDIGLTFTQYTNEAVKINADGSDFLLFGAGRLGNIQRIEGGQPLSTFYGYINDGVFQSQAEVDAHAAMEYKRVGSWKFRDVNNDGKIDIEDQTFIGNPISKIPNWCRYYFALQRFLISKLSFSGIMVMIYLIIQSGGHTYVVS